MAKTKAKSSKPTKEFVSSDGFKKPANQIVNLSKLVGGQKGSSIPPGSYFAFKGKRLIYAAIRQKGTRGGYTSAVVDGKKLKILKGAKSISDVREEMDQLEGSPRILQNKHAMTNPAKFDVGSRMRSTRSFTEVETDEVDPLEDDEDADDEDADDNGEGPSTAMVPFEKPTSREEKSDGTRKRLALREEEQGAGEEDQGTGAENTTMVPFAENTTMVPFTENLARNKANKRLVSDADVDTDRDHNRIPKRIQIMDDETAAEVADPNTQVEDPQPQVTTEDPDVQQALSGTIPVVPEPPVPDTPEPPVPDTPEQTPEDPSHPADTPPTTFAPPDPGPEPSENMQKRRKREDKEDKMNAEAEAVRILETTGNEELAEGVVEDNIVDIQEKNTQSELALEAAAALHDVHNPTRPSEVDVSALTGEQAEGFADGTIPPEDLPQTESDLPVVLNEKQKADKLAGGVAIGTPVQTNYAKADAETSAAMDVSTAKGNKDSVAVDADQEQEHPPGVEFEDKDRDGNVLMSVAKNGQLESAPMELVEQSGNTASANADAAVQKDREKRVEDTKMVDAAIEIEQERKAKQKQAQRDAIESQRTFNEFGKKVKGDAVMDPGRDPDATTPSPEMVQEILDKIQDLPGLHKQLKSGGLVDEATHQLNLAKIADNVALAAKMEFAKGLHVQRMAPPSDEERAAHIARDVMRRRANEGKEGEFIIFNPTNSIGEIAKVQTKISDKRRMMTIGEAQKVREDMLPWWREYQTVRTNQGVHDMERMPGGIIRSSVGDVQLASSVQKDLSQEDKQFYFFLFWAMRTKMKNMDGQVYWEDLFTFAGANGYTELSEARINWLVTGNPNGDTNSVEYEGMDYTPDADGTDLSLTPQLTPLSFINSRDMNIISRTIAFTPIATTPVPGKNMSPSAQGAGIQREYKVVDGKIVALAERSRTLEETGRAALTGVPSKVSNIPDPRFSERGGKQVPNVRIVTRRNPDWDPKKKDSREFISTGDAAPGPNDKFQEVEVADVGAGSRDIGAAIEKAEADRLTAALPFKLYAPIHPQACDRYLGEKNYARLSLEPEKYFKSYTQQPFTFSDIQQQFNWNNFVVTVYGPMLYAFVTDMAMQLKSPVFGMSAPVGVTLEFMELNELIGELERYQSKSADRSSRVGDSAVAQEPLEKHLSDFWDSRENEEEEKMADANVVMIALPDQGDGDDTKKKTDDDKPVRPGEDADNPKATMNKGFFRPSKRVRFGVSTENETTETVGFGTNHVTVGPRDIDQGVRRRGTDSEESLGHLNMVKSVDDKLEKRSHIFRRFNR